MIDVSVVIPARDAAASIGPALRSVGRQLGEHRLEIIVVDAGSADDTATVVRAAMTKDPRIQLVETAPARPGGARNVGLESVTAPWVTFLDADDLWDPAYLASVDEVLRHSGEVEAVCTSIVRIGPDGVAGVPQPPLRWRFEGGARRVDLDTDPGFIVPNVAGVFFRKELIDRGALRFDTELSWSEDFDYACRYLAAAPRRRVAVAPRARYYYRLAPQGITHNAWEQDGKYVDPFERVYRPLVAAHRDAADEVPPWTQHALLYELFWYLHADRAVLHPSAHLAPELRAAVGDRMHSLVAEALTPATVRRWNAVPLGYAPRALFDLMSRPVPTVLAPISYRPRPLHRLRRLSYFYSGPPPQERILVDGQPWADGHGKHVRHTVFDRHVASERILWVPIDATVTLLLNGVAHGPTPYGGEPPRSTPGSRLAVPAPSHWQRAHRRLLARSIVPGTPGFGHYLARRAGMRVRHRRMGDPTTPIDVPDGTWLFHDRDAAADDNAEHLYRHVSRLDPRQPTRFLLSARSADWDRLAAEGFQLVDADDHGAVVALWRSARVAFLSDLSSPSYVAAVARHDTDDLGVVFLQHGVIATDHSRWLNPKRIDLMVTSTHEEHRSIVADGTPYVLTDYEVRRVGMPRYDSLAQAIARAEGVRDLVLIAPTWSVAAREELAGTGHDHPWDARALRSWREMTRDEAFLGVLQQAGLRLRLFLHPLLSGYGPRLWEPSERGSVAPVTDEGLQETLARTHTVITDYSSLGFEAVFAGARGMRYLAQSPDRMRRLDVAQWPGSWEMAHDLASVGEALRRSAARGPASTQGTNCEPQVLDGKACSRLLDVLGEDLVIDGITTGKELGG